MTVRYSTSYLKGSLLSTPPQIVDVEKRQTQHPRKQKQTLCPTSICFSLAFLSMLASPFTLFFAVASEHNRTKEDVDGVMSEVMAFHNQNHRYPTHINDAPGPPKDTFSVGYIGLGTLSYQANTDGSAAGLGLHHPLIGTNCTYSFEIQYWEDCLWTD